MPSYYENLVKKLGEQAAKEHMSLIRQKRKKNFGGGFNRPSVVKRAIEIRKANRENNTPGQNTIAEE